MKSIMNRDLEAAAEHGRIIDDMSNTPVSESVKKEAADLLERIFGPPLVLTEMFGGPVKDITRVGIEDERDEVTEKPRKSEFWSDYKQKRTIK